MWKQARAVMKMNQNDIDKYLDDMITEDAQKIDVVFASRLKEINAQIARLYAKYSKDGQLTLADANKYNRLNKEMERMAEESHKAFKTILTIVEALAAKQFLENYMRSAYLFEMESVVNLGFSIPTAEVIRQAILNPIAELTLSAIYRRHRDDYVRQIQISVAQGLQAGRIIQRSPAALKERPNLPAGKPVTWREQKLIGHKSRQGWKALRRPQNGAILKDVECYP